MEIELFGGPADGVLVVVPDGTQIWVTLAPRMSTEEFLALEHQDPAVQLPAPAELGYAATKEFSKHNGARKFVYVGARVGS